MGAIDYYRRVSEGFARRLQRDAKLLEIALASEMLGGMNVGAMAELALKMLPKLPAEDRQQLNVGPLEQAAKRAAKRKQRESSKRQRLFAEHELTDADLGPELSIGKAGPELEQLLLRLTPAGNNARIVSQGGNPCSDDLGYGPAYLIGADAVARASSALSAIPESAIAVPAAVQVDPMAAKFAEMMEAAVAKGLLPGRASARPSSGDPLRDLFIDVRDYFAAASSAQQCVLRWSA